MTADMLDSTPRKLVLVDGSGYLYRAFHALPPLMSSKGEPTGALHGVVNMINRALKDEQPDFIAVVFDAPGKTFRDELFEQYKAHRPPMPDDLRSQIQPLLDIVAGMGLPLLQINGVEADDVIGTLATQGAAQGLRVIISTGDKDMAQLVNDSISLSNTMTNSRLDRTGVKNKFDVFPEQIVEYLALVGDTSDNIPGIPKVGEKTAAKWLNAFGTTAALIENAGTISGREKSAAASLLANLSDLELSKKLATIDCNVPLDMQPTDLKVGAPDRAKLREIYTRFELKSFLKQLDGGTPPPQSSPASHGSEQETAAPVVVARNAARHYDCVVTEASFAAWLEKLQHADLIAFDTETTSLDYMQAEIVGVSFAVEPDHAAYVPLAHRYPGAPSQLDRALVLAALKPILESERTAKVGHHLKYDAHVLLHYGIAMAGMKYDSMLESYVLNSTVTRHDMDSVAKRYLGIDTIHYEDVAGKGAKQICFDQVDIDRAAEYSAEDADVTLQLHQSLWPQLEAIPSLKSVYETIEQPLVPVLLRMEHTGVLLDSDLLRKQSSELAKRMEEVKAGCHRVAEQPFNVDSPKQLQEILFGKLNIPVLRKTPTGQPSTAEDVLEELAEQYELPKLIMEYRGLTKLKSTYTDKLPLQINEKTGRVHTSYHQAVAATGRLSSQDPNLQNIPIRSSEGRRIRQAFIAPPGYVLLAADYSQIELRIMAHLSGDQSLLTAFAEDRDIHQATAAEVLGVPIDQVTSEQRRSAKAINFGLIYGMSAFGLAKQLGVGRGEAQKYVDLYFDRYPGVKRYMDETRAQARAQGFVETVFGRRLYLQDINNRNAALRQYAERSAINAPMQGTAADIIKRAMIDVYDWLLQSNTDARLVMQVHDELVLEVGANAVDAVTLELRKRMERAAELRVPLKVDVGVGANWDEAH
ncbi:MAG TPA: DNA polymerase I [Steroidobacteraceae bacterium]|nr:DNA polymerase I [Steroidobacteraceae bacterium]